MVSWLAGRSDGDNYGELVLYRFPKDRVIYGPMQIEARINQDAEISQMLNLWNQQGSSVQRGNLLVLPLNDNILYVEPVYLQASQGQIPELRLVVLSDGNNIIYGRTFRKLLTASKAWSPTRQLCLKMDIRPTILQRLRMQIMQNLPGLPGRHF